MLHVLEVFELSVRALCVHVGLKRPGQLLEGYLNIVLCIIGSTGGGEGERKGGEREGGEGGRERMTGEKGGREQNLFKQRLLLLGTQQREGEMQ